MLKQLLIGTIALTGMTTAAAPAMADGRWDRDDRRGGWDRGHDRRDHRDWRGPRRGYEPVRYERRGRGNDRDYWYDRRGNRYDDYDRCKRGNGVNAGTVIGGVAGGVVGNEVAGRGDKTVGTILGAAAGAFLGHKIGQPDRDRRYC